MRMTAILILWLGLIALSGCGEQGAFTRSGSPDETLPVIIHLQTRHEVLTVLASPDGPAYTVRTREGRVLGERLSGHELQARLPHIYRLLKSSYADDEQCSVVWADTLNPGPQQ
jgi:hypothetical protein